MKNNVLKVVSLCLCVVLLICAVCSAVFAITDNGKQDEKEQNVSSAEDVEDEAAELTKDETVYVLAGPDGTVRKIIVSDWIKNALGAGTFSDKTDLDDIVNVKGEESYTMGGDKTAVWDAEGNDIYYQGSVSKELPVAMTVTYKLDGRTVTPDELKGKSGRVSIRFDYENRQYETVEIGGKREKICVPFVMLTGVILDNDVFTNVEITNGRLINDGSRTVVAGIAFPGLQEDLGIDSEKFELPDYVEITADAENFSLGTTVTIAANELFNVFDADRLDGISDLTDKLDELTDAIDQLKEGSSQLYDGLCTLLDKSGELVDGINELAGGARELNNGADALDGGAAELQRGVSQLSDGLNTLASNNDALNDGAKQVFETLLTSARTQLTAAGLDVPEMTVDNYAEVLNDVIISLDETNVYKTALKTVTEAVEANRGYIEEQVTAAVRAEVENGVIAAVRPEVEAKVEAAVREEAEAKVTAAVRTQVEEKVTEAVKAEVTRQVTAAVRESVAEGVIYSATGMDKASYDSAAAAGMIDDGTRSLIDAAIESQMQSDEVTALIASNTAAQMATEQVKTQISANTDAEMKSDEVKKTIKSTLDAQMKSDEAQAAIRANTDAQMKSDEVKAIISGNVSEQMKSDKIKALIAENTDAQVAKAIADNMAGAEVRNQLDAASDGAKQVISLKVSLDGYNTFYLSLKTYTAGVAESAKGASSLSAGADLLKDSTSQLAAGSNALYNGILALSDGAPSLVEGVAELRDGAKMLSDGIGEFSEEGVQKLVDAVDGNIDGLIDRIKATAGVSKSYRNFSGISDGMDGKVKFIYITDGIEN